ncbi:hypothetical protein CRG98_028553 [Punica granatum]|uniref:Bifunctional inhibitor/plant lipid transfer protein/seed storage helical domain-containing protein n=1 Tax=Punica granatum TaxID=22663 RepID=A0A2I0J496_PUNGR|nr:hypothetical protein CRG98_028553 [Punica granatum]
MAGRRMKIGLVAVLVVAAATLWAGAAAQSSSDCTNVLISMFPCLNYISGNSSTPSSNCCSQLDSITQAMALPGACNVQTHLSASAIVSELTERENFKLAFPIAASPTGSPTQTPPTVPSGTGSNTVPSTEGDGSSEGTSIRLSGPLFFVLLFAASYGSTWSTY